MIKRFHFYQKKSKKICGNIFFEIFKNQKFSKKILNKFFLLLLFFIQTLYALDLWNRLELDAHIFTQGRC